RVLVASCVRRAEAGMVVRTASPRCVTARKLVTELLLADHPRPCAKQEQFGTCDLENLGAQLGLGEPRFPATRFLAEGGNGAGEGASRAVRVWRTVRRARSRTSRSSSPSIRGRWSPCRLYVRTAGSAAPLTSTVRMERWPAPPPGAGPRTRGGFA